MIDNGCQGHDGDTLPPISKNWLEMGLLYQHSMVYKTYKIDSHEIQSVFTYLWGIDIQIAMWGVKNIVSWIILKVIVLAQTNIARLQHLNWLSTYPKQQLWIHSDLFIVGPSWLWRVVHIWNPPKLVSLIFFTFLVATSHYTSIIRVK